MNSSVIYLVDDDEDDRFFARLTFQQHFAGTKLVCFEDGEKLLAHIEQQPPGAVLPDLLLLDLNMPRLDGFDTLRALKNHPRWKQVPVAILTTSSASIDQRRSSELGACAFLTKPATHAMLAKTINEGRVSCHGEPVPLGQPALS